jgi:leishmanolysin
VTDRFGNPVGGAIVQVTLSGDGTAPSTFTSSDDGSLTLAGWRLGTTVGQDVLTLTAGTGTLSFIANKLAGDPAALAPISGDQQSGFAGAPLAAPIVVEVFDRFGNPVQGQTASFTVTSGGGQVGATAITDAAGAITVPSWTLGRTALPQTVHVTVGSATLDLSAMVQTDYHIDVRFFGPGMTVAEQTLFINAAARLSAIITGDVPDVTLNSFNVSAACGIQGLPMLDGKVDDVVIYASVQNIDGAGRILASAGPCGFRNGAAGFLPTVGVMEFDAADMDRLAANGTLQDVITHEMLHVLGIGTLWSDRGLLQAEGTSSVTYLGRGGAGGCFDSGGASVCGSGVPVENNGVPGTADAHWRETTFQSELMTGYVNVGAMPLSAITVGSLQDMGYVVNMLAADPFHVPLPGASGNTIPGDGEWERRPPSPGVLISPTGVVTPIKRP